MQPAPVSPAFETLQAGAILYRGELKGENGSWFTNNINVAAAYACKKANETRAVAYLKAFHLRDDMQLVRLLDNQTRDFFKSRQPAANSAYERYIEAHALPAVPYNGPPQVIIWADADGVAPDVQELLAVLGYAGWIIGPGFYRYRTGTPPFHQEVMLLDQSRLLFMWESAIYPYVQ